MSHLHTRAYAKRHGLKTYKGHPCEKGHIRRNTETMNCFYCARPKKHRKEKETDTEIMQRHKSNFINQKWGLNHDK